MVTGITLDSTEIKLLQIVERNVGRGPFNMAHVGPMESALDAEQFLGDAFCQTQVPDMFCQPAPQVGVNVFAICVGHGPEVGAT
jgi:hypothetical protein